MRVPIEPERPSMWIVVEFGVARLQTRSTLLLKSKAEYEKRLIWAKRAVKNAVDALEFQEKGTVDIRDGLVYALIRTDRPWEHTKQSLNSALPKEIFVIRSYE